MYLSLPVWVLWSKIEHVSLVFLSTSFGLLDPPPVEKKYKPLNTTPNQTKEIKVKIIPAQRKTSTEIGMYFLFDPFTACTVVDET